MYKLENINKSLCIFSVIMFGVVITIIKYSGYGVADQIEQLPLIFNAMDKDYLSNDFFVNSAGQSFARLCFTEFIALLAQSKAHLPIVLFVFTMIVNVSISIVTYLFASKLFNNNASGLFASAATMLSVTFVLGWNAEIFHRLLVPAAIATPLLMGAIWAMLNKKIIASVLLCVIATAFHPLMGLEVGYILIFMRLLASMYEKHPLKVFLGRVAAGLTILVAITIVILYLEQGTGSLSDEKFIYILAYFRHPHHYLPGRFGFEDYYNALLFLLPAIFIFVSNKERRHSYDNGIIIFAAIILLLCLGGYVFVEVFPSRLWTTAQTFRLLFFVKWLGLVIIAGSIPTYGFRTWKQLGLLFATSNAVVMFYSCLLVAVTTKIKSGKTISIVIDVVTITIIITLTRQMNPLLQLLPWVIYILLITFTIKYSDRFLRVIAIPVTIAATVIFYTNERAGKYVIDKKNAYIEKVSNYFRLDNTSYFASSEIIMYIRKKTEKDAVFITPPMWGGFRLYAERAIVVDFKAFPFSDNAMKEWYDRLINSYGPTKAEGFKVIEMYNENYRNISDEKLVTLKRTYKFSYAVLYSNTPTNFDVLLTDGRYKLVQMPQ